MKGLIRSSCSSVPTCVEFHLCPSILFAETVARATFNFDVVGRALIELVAALTARSLAGVSMVYSALICTRHTS
jgi:hypothetical protein